MQKLGNLFFGLFIGSFVFVGFGCGSAPEEEAKKEGLLLRDFKPTSMLHVPVTNVERARFPAIDIHNHFNDSLNIWPDHPSTAELVKVMDSVNVEKVVILTGGFGETLQRIYNEVVKPFPDRFVVFTQVDWSRIDEPDFGEKMAEQIRESVRVGARGLKILKVLGLTVRDKSGQRVAVDDPRLDPIWAECGRLGIPVAIHVTDPEAFFHPIGPENERYQELGANPQWGFSGEEFPAKTEILEARDRVMAKHPDTTFIGLHVGNWPENLDAVSEVLDRHPNFVVEFGERQAELGRQPRRAKKFFIDYQDRILFGTDRQPEMAAMYRSYFRWLETADEYFDPWTWPRQGRWKIYGLDLPDDVLEKVYHSNAERIFKQFKGLPAGVKAP